MAMRSVVVDKIGSVTQALNLKHDLRISPDDIPAEEGVVLVVEILTNKSTYNTLELTSGRMAKVVKGDIVVGALGPRRALFGYSGHVPKSVKAGDIIQMLNIGGVLGYFGVQWLWRRSIRHAVELRKFRSSPFNSAVMARESYATYQKFIAHHTHPHPQSRDDRSGGT